MVLFGKIFISSTRQRKTASVPLVGGGRGPALHRMQGVALNLAWFRGGGEGEGEGEGSQGRGDLSLPYKRENLMIVRGFKNLVDAESIFL